MKKNFLWIVALFAALALVVTGCPGDGDENPGGGDSELNWYIGLGDPDDDGNIEKASSNTVTLTPDSDGTAYVRIFWDPPGKDFEKVKITFSMNPGNNIAWQAAWDAEAQWGGYEYIGWALEFVEEVAPSHFNQNWTTGSSATAINPKTMFGICLAVTADDPLQFTVTNVELTGLDGATTTPPKTYDPITDSKWTTTEAPELGDIINITGVALLTGNSPTALGKIDGTDALRVDWQANSSGSNSEVRVQFDISPALDISGKTKFVMTFTGEGGVAAELTFNISPYFEVVGGWGAMLQKEGTSSIDFIFGEDEPDWGNGAILESDCELTGFEIYVDTTNVSVLYITGFSVE